MYFAVLLNVKSYVHFYFVLDTVFRYKKCLVLIKICLKVSLYNPSFISSIYFEYKLV